MVSFCARRWRVAGRTNGVGHRSQKPWNIIERVAVPLSGKLLVTLF